VLRHFDSDYDGIERVGMARRAGVSSVQTCGAQEAHRGGTVGGLMSSCFERVGWKVVVENDFDRSGRMNYAVMTRQMISAFR
jgi:hypothetical protein